MSAAMLANWLDRARVESTVPLGVERWAREARWFVVDEDFS